MMEASRFSCAEVGSSADHDIIIDFIKFTLPRHHPSQDFRYAMLSHDSSESTASDHGNVDILIVGAGPAGLMAACCAARYTRSIRIIDLKESRTKTGHGDGFQSRTLEILDSFGLAQEILTQSMPDMEGSYWAAKTDRGHIQRVGIEPAGNGHKSRFPKALLNQGATEQILLDYLYREHEIRVERLKLAETLHIRDVADAAFPVSVGVLHVIDNDRDCANERETVNARYLVACDGAHSWTREQLEVPTEGDPSGSTWGVFDIVPISNFPDIRRSCAIHSEGVGSIMTIPRENRMVRFYTHLHDGVSDTNIKDSDGVPHELVDRAARTMMPYSLTCKHCDWWSLYRVGRRLVTKYRPHDRIFLVGDAAHSHSPLGGQGMNVSMQDSYNLVWKLGAVLSGHFDSTILDTYEQERRPVAERLMRLDAKLVQAYEDGCTTSDKGVAETREDYSGFMSGIELIYPSSVLVSQEGSFGSAPARNVKIGRRMDSVQVTTHCDGTRTHLARYFPTNGSWRLLVFPGDLEQQERMDVVTQFAEAFTNTPSLAMLNQSSFGKARFSMIEPILIHTSPTTAFNLLDLPDMFHPFDEELGWDYWKVFSDDKEHSTGVGHAYETYGIDDEGPCCLILCRPDQHVAWIGDSEDVAGLNEYFSNFLCK